MLSLWVKADEPSVLTLSSDRASISVTGEAPQPALSQAMDQSSSLKAIQKTGGSPFAIENYVFEAADSCFMPMSSLNALRRDALIKMEEAHIGAHQQEAPLPYISRHEAHVSYPPEESALLCPKQPHRPDRTRKSRMRHFLARSGYFIRPLPAEDCKHSVMMTFFYASTALSLSLQMANRAVPSSCLTVGQLGTDLPGQASRSYFCPAQPGWPVAG